MPQHNNIHGHFLLRIFPNKYVRGKELKMNLVYPKSLS